MVVRDQRAVGFQVQRVRRRVDYSGTDSELLQQPGQLRCASSIGAARESDDHTLGREEHVAAVGEALLHVQHPTKSPPQNVLDLLHFAIARWSAWAKEDGAFAEHQRRIFDEDGVGIGFQRWKDFDGEPTDFECVNVLGVFAADGLKRRSRTGLRAESVDYAARWRAYQGVGEVEDHPLPNPAPCAHNL